MIFLVKNIMFDTTKIETLVNNIMFVIIRNFAKKRSRQYLRNLDSHTFVCHFCSNCLCNFRYIFVQLLQNFVLFLQFPYQFCQNFYSTNFWHPNSVTYNVGLSGSSWYMSTLYNNKDVCTKQVNNEIKTRIENNKLKLLAPEKLRSYIKCLWEKHKRGQPVSFTDIFGCMIGEVLLGKSQMNQKLSSFQDKIKDGKNPLPMMVAVIVKTPFFRMVKTSAQNLTP